MAKNLASTILSILSMYIIFNSIGATEYSKITAPQLIFFFATNIGLLGQDTLILRSGGSESKEKIELMYKISVIGISITLIISIILLFFILDTNPLIIIIFSVAYFLKALSTIPLTYKESKFDVSLQTKTELISQIIYIITIYTALIILNKGILGIAIGFLLSNIILYASVHKRTNLSLENLFNIKNSMPLIKNGILLQYNTWTWQLKDFFIPIILKTSGNDSLLGSYGLASQIIQKIGFLRQIVWRLAIPALASTDKNTTREKSIARSTEINLTIMVTIYMGVNLIFPFINNINENEWSLIQEAYFSIALHLAINSAFTLYCAAMVADLKLKTLFIFHTLFVALNLTTLSLATKFISGNTIIIAESVSALAYIFLYVKIKNYYPSVKINKTLFILTFSIVIMALGYMNYTSASLTLFIIFITIFTLNILNNLKDLVNQN